MSVFSRSSPDRRLSWRDVFLLAGLVIFSLAVYIALSARVYRVGFPLDDAWIHQTYARNLALYAEWTFLPGEVSAGSTSPLWTLLLAIGFLLNLSPYIRTFALGAVLLLGTALLFEQILRRTLPDYQPEFPWAGCLVATEWHLIWAAFSGMETLLHTLLILLVMYFLLAGTQNFRAVGIVIGISVWARPDGITLLVPLALAILINSGSLSERVNRLLKLAFGFSIFLLPYLVFNLALSGAPMPNTFYAKQAEYVNWQLASIGERLFYFALQFFQGISIVFIPAFVQKIVFAVRQRAWKQILAAAWMLGYIFLYVSRLPVYQHGRYLMPALAVFLLIGVSGYFENLAQLKQPRFKNVRSAYISLLLVLQVLSFVFGGLTYARDVAYIESQMVDTARWIDVNISKSARIAAHDIGALGYFGHHSIVDLAGLISPDIIPIMNDEIRLAEYLDAHDVNYLVAFPRWKPLLSVKGESLFTADYNSDAQAGLGRMVVYTWGRP